jgi:hypothetical protein
MTVLNRRPLRDSNETAMRPHKKFAFTYDLAWAAGYWAATNRLSRLSIRKLHYRN